MKREELIAYDKWLTENKWGSCEIVTPEQAADLYLAEHPLPPAEGAEDVKQLEALFNLEQQLDIPMKDRFHLSAKGKELLDAINSLQNKAQSTSEGAEEILNKYPHSIEYPMFIHENNALAAMQEFATLHAQRLAEKMVEEKMPSNKKIHEAALAWAKEHSNAPDKDCPDWLIRDYEAGAYFVRQCMGCWNKV